MPNHNYGGTWFPFTWLAAVGRHGHSADGRADGRVFRHGERILRLDEHRGVRGQHTDPDPGHLGGLVAATVSGGHQQPVDARPELRGPHLARVAVQPEQRVRVLVVWSCRSIYVYFTATENIHHIRWVHKERVRLHFQMTPSVFPL